MAKKKKSASVGRKSRSSSGPKAEKKAPAKKSAKKKKPTKKKASKRSPVKKAAPVAVAPVAHSFYSNHEIGQVAGKLWRTLDDQGAQSLAALKKSTSATDDLVVAAVGWLAREDKLEFATRDGRLVKVSLQ